MVLWQEEAYTRTDKNGDPVSFVGCPDLSERLRSIWVEELTMED